jgi:CheY-like chemotaxis protein
VKKKYLRILVVDDEASIVDLIREALNVKEYSVEVAFDGHSAIRKIKEGHFDAIITDCKMPRKGGIDIYLYCKERNPALARRFLFLTGDVVAPGSLSFMKEHGVPHLTKPFDLRDLISSVNLLFKND